MSSLPYMPKHEKPHRYACKMSAKKGSQVMNRSEQIGDLITALAEAQAGMSTVPRNRTVTVKTKAGGSYEFDYTTFDAMIEHVRVPLTSKGLWFTQTLESADGKYRLVTTLLHKSGQWLASETPLLVDEAGNQAFGSALTYMKRYALAAMLGIASDDDDDANESEGHTIEKRGAPKTADASGRVGGRTVAPNGKDGDTTAAGWAKGATEKVNTFETFKALSDWKARNKDNLDLLASKDPRASNILNDLIGDRLDALGTKEVKAAQ
jgi:hypothetical protein